MEETARRELMEEMGICPEEVTFLSRQHIIEYERDGLSRDIPKRIRLLAGYVTIESEVLRPKEKVHTAFFKYREELRHLLSHPVDAEQIENALYRFDTLFRAVHPAAVNDFSADDFLSARV